ncbi:hypothetical protein [Streptomyces syringium]|uniref:hypothetical protein n=1 Tax=Streptomyces syringium TaxID=76729 RepID=UPI0034020B7E
MGLARSFLRTDADLLILDEPGSGLDPAAEHEIHTRLRARRGFPRPRRWFPPGMPFARFAGAVLGRVRRG